MTRTSENRSHLPFDPTRKTALAVGILYLLTFIGSIPGALLMAPILTNPNYIAGPGAATQIGIAAVCEMVNVLALIGCAVAAFSIVKRQHEGLALGYVATRSFEAAVIVIGIVSILAASSVQQAAAAGGDAAAFVPVGIALVDVRHWTMVIGPSMAAFNVLMFGTLLYRSRPRAAGHPCPWSGRFSAPHLVDRRGDDRHHRAQHGLAHDRRHPVLLLGTGRRALDDVQGLQPERADRGRRDR